MHRSTAIWVALVMMTGVTAAHAQYNAPSQAVGKDASDVEIAHDGQSIATAPPKSVSFEVGASLDFLTTDDPALRGRPIKTSDVVLFRAHGLIPLGRRGELFGGVDLLPKQPSYSDEHRWQGALLGARVRIDHRFAAYARGQVGPNLDHDGFWYTAEAAVQYRRAIADRVLFWESTVGGTYTQLMFDQRDGQFFQTELLTQTGLAIRDRKGLFASWLTFGFHFPVVGAPKADRPDAFGRSLDPQVRASISFGVLGGVSPTLDLFLEMSLHDRGDIENPATTLPILSDGFDQTRVLFGFTKRFGDRRHPSS